MTGGARVVPFPTTHLQGLQAAFQKNHPVGFESFGFLIEAGRRRIVHSADLGAPEDLRPTLNKRVDLLVCELAHFSAEDLFSYLRGRDIRRVAFVHLAKKYWGNIKATAGSRPKCWAAFLFLSKSWRGIDAEMITSLEPAMSQMLKSSSAMGLATITSRILGMVREMVYAPFLGTSWVASAFFLAFQIPNLFRRLLGEGALTAAFIPIFKAKEKQEGDKEMWRAANAVISGLVIASSVVIGLA